ncbi:hypothetical protein N7490_012298 [Penicillium lividum]|nr:hypothetical protein N7490_012298 [Penicillium lividum]
MQAPGRDLRRIMPNLEKKGLDLFTGLSATERSALIQARTGHIGLNAVLYRWGKVDSALCPTCQDDNETIYHTLIMCMGYEELRDEIWGPLQAPHSLELAMSKEHAKRTARFLLATKRLTYLLPPPPIPDNDSEPDE